jgi:hypothetical protein
MLYAALPELEWRDADLDFDQMKKLAERYLHASI